MISESFIPDPNTIKLITPDQAWYYRIIPIGLDGNRIRFITDQDDEAIINEIQLLTGREVELIPHISNEIDKLLGVYYRKANSADSVAKFNSSIDSVNFLTDLISDAKRLKSSDIHIEIYEEKCRIRFRIDGLMVERYTIAPSEYPLLINKIKIVSNLDIAEKRLPQDGRLYFNVEGISFDIRVSVLPTLYGEKVVLRLLSNDSSHISLDALGFSPKDMENYLSGLKKPNGIILISGPTGSGKTTTLYATLKLLNKLTRNILTIEDPIEYTLEGINQVQLKENIGLSFASTLRTFLRQDPDIIMVGEIRDAETAAMAIRAALTGHLVLSTIHTNSAWGTISRLVDMDIPPFLLANTLNTTVAQRLVRLLCNNCKQCKAFDSILFPSNFTPTKLIREHYTPVGCEECYYTGYKGRHALYEVIPIDKELVESIKQNRQDINDVLVKKGISTLSQNAFSLFENGMTSIDEVYPLLVNN